MTGFDILLLVLIGTFVYLGYRRGVIGETFDIVTAIVPAVIALMVYVPLGASINKWTEWGEVNCQWLAALGVGLPIAVGLLIFGMHLDRIARDDKKIPDAIMAYGGLAVSIPKSLICLWLVLMLLMASPFYSETSREEFQNAPVVNFIESTGGVVGKGIFNFVAPAPVRKKIGPFLQKGF